MLSVTFNQPIVIDAASLHSLLSLANTPAVVAPYLNGAAEAPAAPAKRTRAAAAPAAGDKPKRTRATKAEMEARRLAAAGGVPADPVPEAPKEEAAPKVPAKVEAEAPAKPKRDRRSPAKKAADAAAEAAAKAPAKPAAKAPAKEKAGSGGPTPDAEALLARFATLIDSDFDKAQEILTGFGVKRFSELPAAEYPALDAKLKEAKV